MGGAARTRLAGAGIAEKPKGSRCVNPYNRGRSGRGEGWDKWHIFWMARPY